MAGGLIEPAALPHLAGGAIMLSLAAWLLYLDARSRLHQAFGLFLVLGGLLRLGEAFSQGPGAAGLAERLVPYAQMGLAFATLAFAFAYRARHGGGSPTRIPLAGVALLAAIPFLVLYVLDHSLWYPPQGGPGPLMLFIAAKHPANALIALVLAHDYASTRAEPRLALLVLSLGFALDPIFAALAIVVTRVEYLGVLLASGAPAHFVYMLFGAVSAAALVPLALTVKSIRRAGRAPGRARETSAYQATLLLPVGSYVLVLLSGAPEKADVEEAIEGIWALALPLIATYAILRHRLFDIDLRVKRTLRRSTVAGVFIAVFFVASQSAALVLGGSMGTYFGIIAAGALLTATGPLQRWGVRVADAAMPDVTESPSYLDRRKLQVYRDALEDVLERGRTPTREEPSLARLRAELGISDHDHAVIEETLRAAGAPSQVQLEPGQVFLGRYRVLRKLGEGGEGAAFLCEDQLVHRQVVVKGLHGDDPTPEGLATVLREARAIAAIRHPNVVSLLNVEQRGDRAFLVMEYLEAGSLQDRLHSGPLPPAAFRRLAADLLEALEAVHAAGATHRDVKPSNVLFMGNGQAKLADFGLAWGPALGTTAVSRDGPGGGTVLYMSPEQARGHEATAASDIFSAAATLFEAYSGRPYLEPRPGETHEELRMRAAQRGPFREPLEAPPGLVAWFAKALHPKPQERFRSAREMRQALERALAAAPVGAARRKRAA